MRLSSRFSPAEQAVLKTLIYSDIFDFPLTKEELWRFLISEETVRKDDFEKALKRLGSSFIKKQGDYYCLSGRERIVTKRLKNLFEAQKKLEIAKKAAYYLSFIPSVQFIGISGGLALGNVDKEDDIDFFIITKKSSLFTTRFLVLVVLELLNLRRRRNDKNPENKICVNLLVDEDNLSWPKKMRDLYTAHEIIQIQPIFERNGIYKKFLAENKWVKRYFPNFDEIHPVIPSEERVEESHTTRSLHSLRSVGMTIFEQLLRKLQEHYMRKHKTIEIVSKGFIAFHPKDYRTKTMKILRSKLTNFGLLTKL